MSIFQKSVIQKHLRNLDKEVVEKAYQKYKEIDKTDKQIDQMVYELYDLTKEEIKLVEENV